MNSFGKIWVIFYEYMELNNINNENVDETLRMRNYVIKQLLYLELLSFVNGRKGIEWRETKQYNAQRVAGTPIWTIP